MWGEVEGSALTASTGVSRLPIRKGAFPGVHARSSRESVSPLASTAVWRPHVVVVLMEAPALRASLPMARTYSIYRPRDMSYVRIVWTITWTVPGRDSGRSPSAFTSRRAVRSPARHEDPGWARADRLVPTWPGSCRASTLRHWVAWNRRRGSRLSPAATCCTRGGSSCPPSSCSMGTSCTAASWRQGRCALR